MFCPVTYLQISHAVTWWEILSLYSTKNCAREVLKTVWVWTWYLRQWQVRHDGKQIRVVLKKYRNFILPQLERIKLLHNSKCRLSCHRIWCPTSRKYNRKASLNYKINSIDWLQYAFASVRLDIRKSSHARISYNNYTINWYLDHFRTCVMWRPGNRNLVNNHAW